jgi:PIN domain nuclease of toxin-antitoxin system
MNLADQRRTRTVLVKLNDSCRFSASARNQLIKHSARPLVLSVLAMWKIARPITKNRSRCEVPSRAYRPSYMISLLILR